MEKMVDFYCRLEFYLEWYNAHMRTHISISTSRTYQIEQSQNETLENIYIIIIIKPLSEKYNVYLPYDTNDSLICICIVYVK